VRSGASIRMKFPNCQDAARKKKHKTTIPMGGRFPFQLRPDR
jgi:hypothetical protein